jgi:alkaline phosphatase D
MRKMLVITLLATLLSSGIVQARGGELLITHGPISGEVTDTSAVLWARGNAPGLLTFQVADNADFEGDLIVASVHLDQASDFSGEVRVEGL